MRSIVIITVTSVGEKCTSITSDDHVTGVKSASFRCGAAGVGGSCDVCCRRFYVFLL